MFCEEAEALRAEGGGVAAEGGDGERGAGGRELLDERGEDF